jgi:hypothetical protein
VKTEEEQAEQEHGAEHSWQGVYRQDVEVTLICVFTFIGDQPQIVRIYDMIRIN